MAITIVTLPNVSIENQPQKYTGLSSDTKPTVASHDGLPKPTPGSEYWAYDTGIVYKTYDGTNWVTEPGLPAGTNLIGKVEDSFGGVVYENQDTAAADTARRFETTSKKLRDVVIQVTTYAQYFGDSSNQRYLVGAGETLGFTKLDISTLYFKNATAGQNGVVSILGVEE